MAHITHFPQTIFVTVEEDGDNDWLSANTSMEGSLGDSPKAVVGIYKFVRAEDVSPGPIVTKARKTTYTKSKG